MHSDFEQLLFSVLIPTLVILGIVILIMGTTESVDRLMGW